MTDRKEISVREQAQFLLVLYHTEIMFKVQYYLSNSEIMSFNALSKLVYMYMPEVQFV